MGVRERRRKEGVRIRATLIVDILSGFSGPFRCSHSWTMNERGK